MTRSVYTAAAMMCAMCILVVIGIGCEGDTFTGPSITVTGDGNEIDYVEVTGGDEQNGDINVDSGGGGEVCYSPSGTPIDCDSGEAMVPYGE